MPSARPKSLVVSVLPVPAGPTRKFGMKKLNSYFATIKDGKSVVVFAFVLATPSYQLVHRPSPTRTKIVNI